MRGAPGGRAFRAWRSLSSIPGSSGDAKIIDFGVARVTDSDIAVTTMQTEVGQLIGTLKYVSPEQIEADPRDLDVRNDVYARRRAALELAGLEESDIEPRLLDLERSLEGVNFTDVARRSEGGCTGYSSGGAGRGRRERSGERH